MCFQLSYAAAVYMLPRSARAARREPKGAFLTIVRWGCLDCVPSGGHQTTLFTEITKTGTSHCLLPSAIFIIHLPYFILKYTVTWTIIMELGKKKLAYILRTCFSLEKSPNTFMQQRQQEFMCKPTALDSFKVIFFHTFGTKINKLIIHHY